MLNYKKQVDNILSYNDENINIGENNNISSDDKTNNLVNENIKSHIGGENTHTVPANHQKNNIVVETDFTTKTFTFYNSTKNLLGSFSIYEFIKFITANVSNTFLITVNSNIAKPIIERYICNISITDKPKRYNIIMLNWLESPFMGNIDTLIKLYLLINNFEKNELSQELSKLNEQERKDVISIYNTMIYNLIEHILKIISMLNGKLINNSKIKDTILQYSIIFVNRLSKLIKNEFDSKSYNIEQLKLNLQNIANEKKNIYNRLEILEKNINMTIPSNNIINGPSNNIVNKNTNTTDMLVTSDNLNTQTLSDESNVYGIQDGKYKSYKDTNNSNTNLTMTELMKAVDKITSSRNNTPVQPTNNVATSLMDIMSIHNTISNKTSDNFFQSETEETYNKPKKINYLSSN